MAELALQVPANGVELPTGFILIDPKDKMKPGWRDNENPSDDPSSMDLNDTVLSGSTLYIAFVISDSTFQGHYIDHFNNEFWKVKVTAEDGAKYITSIKSVEKKLDGLEAVDKKIEGWDPGDWDGTGTTKGKRWWVLEIKLKEFPTDDEYKISLKLTATAKKPIERGYFLNGEEFRGIIPAGTKATSYTEPFWVTNRSVNADADFAAGHRGEVLKPAKNEDNSITWEDNNHTLAWLDFSGDDDGKVFYPKMSTKWDDQEYAEKFADQDAYLYDFLYNPKLASTSRAALKLRIPYLDEDGELAVAPEEIVIYRTIDGELVDITASGKICETEDGEWVFVMKTRELGTYIIAQKPAEAVETEEPAGEETLSAEEDPVSAKPLLPSYVK